MSALRRSTRFVCTVALTLGLVLSLVNLPNAVSSWLELPLTAQAQPVRIEDIWQQVYQQLPDLPLENQYVNKETGKVSTENTLINRLIRYHVFVKSRPVNYRLDWKLTLADYLGANERMDASAYPSGSSLRVNPMEGDIAAVQGLTRAQRDALVDALVSMYTRSSQTPSGSGNGPAPTASPSPTVTLPAPTTPVTPPTPALQPAPSRFPQLPQPGDAQLLQP